MERGLCWKRLRSLSAQLAVASQGTLRLVTLSSRRRSAKKPLKTVSRGESRSAKKRLRMQLMQHDRRACKRLRTQMRLQN
eukprot:2362440-Amphidinium_carterae.3